MSTYYPEGWSLIRIEKDGKVSYKIFGSWRGSFTTGDSWKLNSGVKKARFNGVEYVFEGFSGSEYICHPETEGNHSGYNLGVLNSILYYPNRPENQKVELQLIDESDLELGVEYD